MGQVFNDYCVLLVRTLIQSAMKARSCPGSCRKIIYAIHIALQLLLMQSCDATVDLTIGVLIPWNTSSPDAYPFWAPRTLGAVNLAVNDINDAGILPNDKMLKFAYKDSDCDAKQASGSAVELYSSATSHISSYFAPPCSIPCRSVTDLTDFWKKPTIAWFCAYTERANDKYLIRTYSPFSSINNIATITMHYFKWTLTSIVFPIGTTWENLAFDIRTHLEGNSIDVALYTGYEQPLTLDQAKAILTDVKRKSHGKQYLR